LLEISGSSKQVIRITEGGDLRRTVRAVTPSNRRIIDSEKELRVRIRRRPGQDPVTIAFNGVDRPSRVRRNYEVVTDPETALFPFMPLIVIVSPISLMGNVPLPPERFPLEGVVYGPLSQSTFANDAEAQSTAKNAIKSSRMYSLLPTKVS